MNKIPYYLLICLLMAAGCQKQITADVNPTVSNLSADKSTLSLDGITAAKDSFNIQSNINWNIVISPASADWLTASKTSGNGNAKILISTSKDNNADSIQKATITISPVNDTTVKAVIIAVSRAKAPIVKDTSRNAYGGTASDDFASSIAVAGGGAISIGYTVSKNGDVTGNRTWEDIWVVKTGADGKIVWQKTYGGSGRDFGVKIIAAHGGGYIIVGSGEVPDGDLAGANGDDTWLAKIDDNGNIVWKKTFGGSAGDYLFSIAQSADGGYILAGMTTSNDGDATGNHGGNDGWVVKTDGNGNKVWSKVLGGSGFDVMYAVVATADGGFIAAGQSQSNNGDVSGNHGYDDAWAVKLDANGNKVWQKAYGGTGYEAVSAMVASGDGGYILAGVASSNDGDVTGNHGGQDGWLVKIDANGNKVWQKTYGGSKQDDFTDIIKTTDGYVIAGYTRSDDLDPANYKGGLTDGWIIKTDAAGTQLAQKLQGGTDEEYLHAIIETSSNNYLLVGVSFSDDKDVIGWHGDGDGWVYKFKF